MAGSLIKLVVALCAFGGLVALAPSCADNRGTIFVRQMQTPKAPECKVTNDPSASVIQNGVLDLGLKSSYVGFPLFGNQLVAHGDPKQTRAETSRIQIQGAEVRVADLKGREFGFFSLKATGFADPSTTSDPTFGVTEIELIPKAVGDKIANELRARKSDFISVTATFKLFGKTLGGQTVQSTDYEFPINVCIGCLVTFPSESNDPTLRDNQPNCAVPAKVSTVQTCGVGQDATVSCQVCNASLPVCTPCQRDDQCKVIPGAKCDTSRFRCTTAAP